MKFEIETDNRDVAHNDNVPAQLAIIAAWRGRFNIPSRNVDINVAANLLNNAAKQVQEVESIMPESISLEIIPRIDVWPASFKSSPPTEHNVGLLFFSEDRDAKVLDSLINDAIWNDLALKAMIDRTELVIFTSVTLPAKLQRFQGKFFFWGIFRGRDYHQPIYLQSTRGLQTLSTSSGNHGCSEGEGSPITTSSMPGNSTSASKVDTRGRRLDNAWEHAKPLDELRQKAQCKYCGFISLYGGISRLKAHLAGGHPRIRLPGCNKVSPEIKVVMAYWFSEWVKNTKAIWAKEIRGDRLVEPKRDAKVQEGTSLTVSSGINGVMPEQVTMPATKMKTTFEEAGAARSGRRGRRLDDAWEHATPLDEARQKTQCNYCGFVSPYGGISRLKAHLGGGCQQMHLQGCPRVSPEVKSVMENWFNEWSKTSNAIWTKKLPHGPANSNSKRGRPSDETWEHAIQLDETRQNTQCKYCGFVSRGGGIGYLKVHLGGGDPTLRIQGCPNVPPEVKSLIAEGVNNCSKRSRGIPVETVEEVSREAEKEAQWFEKRHHVLQETLDEIRNTSVKESLQKLIDEKNAELQHMQFEIRSLESRLASMP